MTGQKSAWSFTLVPNGGKFVAGPIQVHVEGMSPSGPLYGGTVIDASVKASVSK